MANEKDLKNMLTDMDLDNVTGGRSINFTIEGHHFGHDRPLWEYKIIIIDGRDGNTYRANIGGDHAPTTAQRINQREADYIKEACKGQVLLGSLHGGYCFINGEC